MHVHAFGSLSVSFGGPAIKVTAPKERILVAALAMNAGKTTTNDELCRALWGADWAPALDSAFRPLVRRLRRRIGKNDLIVTESMGYRLAGVNPEEVDILAFEALGRAGTAAATLGDWDQALTLLAQAEALRQRGAPFADIPSEYLRHKHLYYLETRSLLIQEKRIEAAVRVSQCHVAADVVPDLELLVRDNPRHEQLRWLLMLALYRTGRQGDAQHAFLEAWKHGKTELGREPSQALRKLNDRILANDPVLLREPFLGSPDT